MKHFVREFRSTMAQHRPSGDGWDDYPAARTAGGFVPGFNLPLSQQGTEVPTAANANAQPNEAELSQLHHHDSREQQQPPMLQQPQPQHKLRQHSKKAAKHRKRHVPVGPAGVWFQTTQQQQLQSKPVRPRVLNNEPGSSCDTDVQAHLLLALQEDEDHLNLIRKNSSSPSSSSPRSSCSGPEEDPKHAVHSDTATCTAKAKARVNATANSFHSPAWTAAQCALHVATPSCPAYWSLSQKYAILKQHLPAEYVLFGDIRSENGSGDGKNNWKLRANDQKLLVQVLHVSSVTATTNDRLWTVLLQDETGSTMTAWLQPALVHAEQQHIKYTRPGYVWLLQACTIQLLVTSSSSTLSDDDEDEVENENDDNATSHHSSSSTNRNRQMDRMLLVSESNIAHVWSNSSADQISDTDYIAWMERRNELSTATATALLLSDSATASRNTALNDSGDGGGGSCAPIAPALLPLPDASVHEESFDRDEVLCDESNDRLVTPIPLTTTAVAQQQQQQQTLPTPSAAAEATAAVDRTDGG
jgi:hypothetical protein